MTDLKAAVNGSASVDPDGTIASYAWTFGDGSTATGVPPTHPTRKPEPTPSQLTVTDNEGGKRSVVQAGDRDAT